MKVLSNTGGVAYTNCFVIADEIAGECVLFDAPDHTTAPLLQEIARQQWKLIGLWLTHGHFDHIADHSAVTTKFPAAKVLIHALDEPKLIHPKQQLAVFGLDMTIASRRADAYVKHGDTLKIGSLEVRVIETPGHAPGHVCYHLPAEKVLVVGDLIIGGSIGRTDLPDSDEAAMADSVRRVMALPNETALLPGHGKVSSLADERANNAFVKSLLARG